MGLMGFLRKNKHGGSKKRSKKAADQGPTILPELPGKIEQAQEGTNSTEPESTHHEADAIIVNEESVSPLVHDGDNGTGKSGNDDEEEEPEDLAGVENPSFEIVESAKTDTSSLVIETNGGKDSPKDETSILEKFKTKSPVRRGNHVAERAAWLQNSAFKEENSKNSEPISSVSSQNARAKKMFWEGKTFPKETSNAPDPPSVRHRTDVLAKKKWLETVAFTPSGGGNMTNCNEEDRTPERRKHTIGLLPSSPMSSHSNDEDGQGRTAKDLIEAIASYDKQSGDVFLDKEEDPYEWAYEVWFKKGLLPWRSSSFAEGEVPVYSTFRADILSPSRSWGSSSEKSNHTTPRKHTSSSPASSPGMESVPEQSPAMSGEGAEFFGFVDSKDTSEMATCSNAHDQFDSGPSTPERSPTYSQPGSIGVVSSDVQTKAGPVDAGNSVDEVSIRTVVNLSVKASASIDDTKDSYESAQRNQLLCDSYKIKEKDGEHDGETQRTDEAANCDEFPHHVRHLSL